MANRTKNDLIKKKKNYVSNLDQEKFPSKNVLKFRIFRDLDHTETTKLIGELF